ncbi:MAG: hypothetical protein FWC53_00115 [Firmicutes bacterium]|nr:hypothetical protein [Bacillota bacterium]
MKVIKIAIIILILVLLAVLIILGIKYFLGKKTDTSNVVNTAGNTISTTDEIDQPQAVTDATKFYAVVQCINNYLNVINKNSDIYYARDENNNYVKSVSDEQIKQNIYGLLSPDYIKKNSITADNVYNYVEDINGSALFVPLAMNVLAKSNIETYAVHGMIQDLDYNVIKDLYIIVNVDAQNTAFSIEGLNGTYTSVNDVEIVNNNTAIAANDFNMYIQPKVDDQYIINAYIDTYKKLALGSPEYAYNLLDKDYAVKRFGNLNGFKAYVQENKSRIVSIVFTKYKKTDENNYTQYVCVDKNGNYYIFRETAIMQYALILDKYTIDLPEFLANYNSTNAQGKTALNIQKIVESINAKDYNYAYGKLDSGFKNNYFPTLQSFETYMKQNMFENNKVEYGDFKETAGVYTYAVSFTDSSGQDSKTIQKTFIVKLGTGTDFTISFNT